jgi:hypothetical protein
MTPIEVLWVEEPPGAHYYFAVSCMATDMREGGRGGDKLADELATDDHTHCSGWWVPQVASIQ